MDRLSPSNADAIEQPVRQSASVIRSDWGRSEAQADRQIAQDSTDARLKQSLAILSEAAQSFALELDFANLFQLIARHGSHLLGAEQVIVQSGIPLSGAGSIARGLWEP